MIELNLLNTTAKAFIDDEDLPIVLAHRKQWCYFEYKSVFARSRILKDKSGQGRKILLHRLVMNMLDTNLDMDIDHINRNPLDNRKCNLRLIPHRLNVVNSEKSFGVTSKYKGVSWHKKAKKWMVMIKSKGHAKYGGIFKDEIEAAKKANELYKKHFGDFAYLNPV